MNPILAFDIYGTLIDTHGVIVELQKLIGDRAADFSQLWRDKQLEYTFRRGLMQQYVDFSICTRQALDFCNEWYQSGLSDQDKARLIQCYTSLPVFDDVVSGLVALNDKNIPMYAFSNGTAAGVAGLLQNAGIIDYFADIISVDEVKTFKPSPAVYQHFLTRTGAKAGSCWLVSSNPFDILGAAAVGMQTVWIKRTANAIFDPWGIKPTASIGSLNELLTTVQSH